MRVDDVAGNRPGRFACNLPHHRMPFNSGNEGSICVSMTWRGIIGWSLPRGSTTTAMWGRISKLESNKLKAVDRNLVSIAETMKPGAFSIASKLRTRGLHSSAFSAQRKHVLWDTLVDVSLTVSGTAQVELKRRRVQAPGLKRQHPAVGAILPFTVGTGAKYMDCRPGRSLRAAITACLTSRLIARTDARTRFVVADQPMTIYPRSDWVYRRYNVGRVGVLNNPLASVHQPQRRAVGAEVQFKANLFDIF